ncbi:hypothetical protein L6R50_11540 [Myxococcota bacterium]|nr:hypothetical protein [Myxococcota bacterium]
MTDTQRMAALEIEGLSPLLLGYPLAWVPGMPQAFLSAARRSGLGQVGDLRSDAGRQLLGGDGISEGDLARALKVLSTWRETVAGKGAGPEGDPGQREGAGVARRGDAGSGGPGRRLQDLFRFPSESAEPGPSGRREGAGVAEGSAESERPRRRLVRPSPVPEPRGGDEPPPPVGGPPPSPSRPPTPRAATRGRRTRAASASPAPSHPAGPTRDAARPTAGGEAGAWPPEQPWFLSLGLGEVPKALSTVPVERLRLHWRLQRSASELRCRSVGDLLATTPAAWLALPNVGRQVYAGIARVLQRVVKEGIPADLAVEADTRSSEVAQRLSEFLGEDRFRAFELRLALARGAEPTALLALSRRLDLHPEQIRQHELRSLALIQESGLSERLQQVIAPVLSRLALRRQGLVALAELDEDRFFDRWSPAGVVRLLDRLGSGAPAVLDDTWLVARDARFASRADVDPLVERVVEWARRAAERACEPLDTALERFGRAPASRGIPLDLAEWALLRQKDLIEVHGGITFLGLRYRLVVQVAEALTRDRGEAATVQQVRDAVSRQLHEAAWPSHNLVHTTLLRYPQFRRVAPATFEWVDPGALSAAPAPPWLDGAIRAVVEAGVPLRSVDLYSRLADGGALPDGVTEQLLAAELRRHPDRVRFLPRGQIVTTGTETPGEGPALLEDLVYDELLDHGPLGQRELEERIRPVRAFSSVSVHGVLRLEPWVFRRDDDRHDLVEKYLPPSALRDWLQRVRDRVRELGRPYHRDDFVADTGAGTMPALPEGVEVTGLFDVLRRQEGFSVGGYFLTTRDLPERMRVEPIVGSILWVLERAEGPLTTREISDALGGRLTPRDVHRGLQRAPEAVRDDDGRYALASPPRWNEQPGRKKTPGPARTRS